MNHDHHESQEDDRDRRGLRIDFKWVLFGFLAVGAYFLFTEHRAHAISYLPFLLLAACPLMHLFHGHGGHGDNADKPGGHRHDGEAR